MPVIIKTPMKKIMAISLLALTAAGVSARQPAYPVAPSDDTVDEYFGKKVADPYRPLEDDTSAVTAAWVKAQNRITRSYLDTIPFRDAIKRRLTALNDYVKPGIPSRMHDGRYYFYENDGLRNQSVLYRVDSLGGTPEVFIDPNLLSADGTVALTGVYMSNDGRRTAYKISRNGSDWAELYVMDTDSRQLLGDHIEWAKFTGASWMGDGFFYSAYAQPAEGKEFSNSNECQRIYYHKLGTPQSEDRLIYVDEEHPLHFFSVQVPEDESVILLYGSGEGLGNSLRVKRMEDAFDSSRPWTVIEPSQDYEASVVDVVDGKMYILTNWGAPRYRLMVADVDNPARGQWRELVPEGEGVLQSAEIADRDKLVLVYSKDASQQLWVYGLDGKPVRQVALPGYGSVYASVSDKSPEMFYAFISFTTPTTIYRYDVNTGDTQLYRSTALKDVNMDDYVTQQVFYPSKDGTKIPMFITYKKGVTPTGDNPVYLYGYGGFNISLEPSFSSQRMLWLENGGIYAQANLRGGGEYGEPWHLAGTKMHKQNVFDDFAAAAEYLIDEGWTNPSRIAVAGGSNGGLLVGATVNQRPELFRVAIPSVGVMDMMRYHLFTIGWNWASDYGTSADSPEMAAYLLGYSPIHNVADGKKYPAILVTTADHDDRVVPAHSFKYAATLQAADTGDAPKLIRIETNAGHGAGKPVSKIIDEQTDIYTFIFNNMGLTPSCTGR